jgi:hypothetical protein
MESDFREGGEIKMKKDPDLSRRKFLSSASVLGAGALAAGVGAGSLIAPKIAGAACGGSPISVPLPFAGTGGNPVLDVDLVRKLAWKHYFNGG